MGLLIGGEVAAVAESSAEASAEVTAPRTERLMEGEAETFASGSVDWSRRRPPMRATLPRVKRDGACG